MNGCCFTCCAEIELDLRRGMCFPPRWDPFFSEFMTLEDGRRIR
jgi:hypothetical protein